ncbi:hypothetical protein [Halorientalis sp.]|uniref:hypothetical protein n=1 Tax=Halorientalis sp. TaxID=1931229 RepID=UPI002623C7D2|nr:hypothetical protein [Halorientalis sp.]
MNTEQIRALPLRTGTVAGVGAYLLGYVFTYLLVGGDVRESLGNRAVEAIAGQDVTYQAVGWVFYMPTWSRRCSRWRPLFGGSSSVDRIAQVDAFSAVLYLLPALLLFGAGLAVGRRRLGTADPASSAKAGATVAVGYLPLAVVGASLFR